jgi:iron-sulfur cluster assembly accessory protein
VNISVEGKALSKISRTLEKKPGYFLKIIVARGGCAGMRFKVSISKKLDEDIEVDASDLIILTNKESFKYLEDITIFLSDDISEDVLVKNNKAKRLCKCGNSFEENSQPICDIQPVTPKDAGHINDI